MPVARGLRRGMVLAAFHLPCAALGWRTPSVRLGGNLLQHRFPLPLLCLHESNGFSRRHRSRIAAARCDLLLEIRFLRSGSETTLRRSSLTLWMIFSGVPIGATSPTSIFSCCF